MAIGFGLIGCGMIANFHARAVADIRGASVIGCFDTVPAAADRLAQTIGCTAYHNLQAMLENPRIDVVTICTPSGAHLEPAFAAAKAGKQVIDQKRRKAFGDHARSLRSDHPSVCQGGSRPVDDFSITLP